MTRPFAPTCLVLLCSLAVSAPVAARAYTGQELAPQAKVTLMQARTIALKAAPGTITDQELNVSPAAAGFAIRSTSSAARRPSRSASMPRPVPSWRTKSRDLTPTRGARRRCCLPASNVLSAWTHRPVPPRSSACCCSIRVARLHSLAQAASPRLDAVEVIASPTLCLTPPLMSDVADADSHLLVNRRIVRNTAWVNYLGLCAITMPVGRDRTGMPVGLQLTAQAHAEEKLLTIAVMAERVLGTAADRLGTPPLLAR